MTEPSPAPGDSFVDTSIEGNWVMGVVLGRNPRREDIVWDILLLWEHVVEGQSRGLEIVSKTDAVVRAMLNEARWDGSNFVRVL